MYKKFMALFLPLVVVGWGLLWSYIIITMAVTGNDMLLIEPNTSVLIAEAIVIPLVTWAAIAFTVKLLKEDY